MERDQIDLDRFVQQLSKFETIDCRICLRQRGEDWYATHIIGDVKRQDSFKDQCIYRYEQEIFLSDTISTTELSSWLINLKGNVSDLAFEIPKLNAHVRHERYSTALAANHLYNLPYPFSLYLMSSQDNEEERHDPFVPLVKAGQPSFPNYETAFFRLMLDSTHQAGVAIPKDLLVIRIGHSEAWIQSVSTESDSVTVVLDGSNCQGTQLTVGGNGGILVNEVINNNGGEQLFKLSETPLDNLWAVLSRGDRWLDWRDGYTSRVSDSDTWTIRGVQPANLSANIEQLRLQGENEQLEYKSRIPDNQDKFLKTVAAFANGSGGIILIGIADDGKVEGIKEDVNKFMDGIVNRIRNRVTPEPPFQLEKCAIDNRQVVAVFVGEGEQPPYGLDNRSLSVYVRRHGTTFDATQSEIRALGTKNQSSYKADSYLQF